MTIGLGIFLVALGLILALGVRDRLSDFDLSVIGWVLTGVGALAIILSFVVASVRGRSSRGQSSRTETIDRRDDPDVL